MASKPRKTALVIVSLLLVLLVIAAGLVIYFMVTRYQYLGENPMSAFLSGGNCAPQQTNLPKATPQGQQLQTGPTKAPEKTAPTGSLNIMLMGMDSDTERDKKSMGSRNDMNMILNIDFDKKTARMLVIPRDSRIKISQVNDAGKITGYTDNRINTAYANGGYEEKYGFQNVMHVASSFLSCNGTYDIPINYYVCINLDGIEPICDAVGGVPMTLDSDFPGLKWKAGQTVIIKGEVAQMYLRWRHPDQTGDNLGDIGRGERQQKFLIALAKKIKSMGPVETVQKLFSSMQQYMRTNMSVDQIVALAQVLKGMNVDNIQMYSVPGKNANYDGASMWAPDTSKLPDIVEEVFYSK